MKNYLFFIFCFFIITVHAQQEQKGIVLEINSKKHPVGGVQVAIKNSQPTYSGNDGLFLFTVNKTRFGDRIIVDSIVPKPNYIVINRGEVNRWSITNDSYPWPHLIEVAHRDSLKIWRDQYIHQADFFSKQELEKQLAALKSKWAKGEETQENYLKQSEQYKEENRRLQIQLNDLAERLAYINRDFALPVVNEALTAYRDGDIQKATLILAKIDVVKEIEIAEHNLKVAQQDFNRAQENKRQWIQAAMVLGRFYSNKIKLDSANYYFEKAILHDSLNFNNLVEYASFLQNRMLNYTKALKLYLLAVPLSNGDVDRASIQNQIGRIKSELNYPFDQISKHYKIALELLTKIDSLDFSGDRIACSIFSNLGELLKSTYHFEEAEDNFILSTHSMQKIVEWTNTDYNKLQYAQMLTELGNLHIAMRKSKPAMENLTDALRIWRSVNTDNSISSSIGLIATLNTLGKLYLRLNDAKSAESFINEALTQCSVNVKKDSLMYLAVFAETLDALGQCKTQQNDVVKAEQCFKEALTLAERLVTLNSDVYQSQFANILTDYGILQCQQNQYQSSKKYFERSIKIKRDLVQNNPETYSIDLIDVMKEVSNLYIQTNQHLKAEGALLESLFLCYNLQNYWKVNLDFEFVEIYQKLAKLSILQNRDEETNIYFKEASFYINSLINSGYTEFKIEKDKIELQLTQIKKSKKNSNSIVTSDSEELNSLNSGDLPNYPNWLGSISYFLILEKNLNAAEYMAVRTLSLFPEQSWIKANLALTLLLQSKFESAKQIYLELKDQPYPLVPNKTFKDIFIQDLDEIEIRGFKHPDIAQARILLAKH